MSYIALTEARLRQRAVGRVLLCAQVVPRLAAIHGHGRDMVRTWLCRYRDSGVADLQDLPPTVRRHFKVRGWR